MRVLTILRTGIAPGRLFDYFTDWLGDCTDWRRVRCAFGRQLFDYFTDWLGDFTDWRRVRCAFGIYTGHAFICSVTSPKDARTCMWYSNEIPSISCSAPEFCEY